MGLTKAEEELVSDLNEKYSNSKMEMEQNYYQSWEEMNDYLLGEQWQGKEFSTDTRVVINHIFRLTYTIAPILTSMMPEIYVLPYTEGQQFKEGAEQLQDYLQAINKTDNKEKMVSEINIMRALYGNAIVRTSWDAEQKRPTDTLIPPWHFYIDPTANSLDDARWICIESWMTPEEIEWTYKQYHQGKLKRALDKAGIESRHSERLEGFWNGVKSIMGFGEENDEMKVREFYMAPTMKKPRGQQVTLIGDYPIVNTYNHMYRRERQLQGSKYQAPFGTDLKKVVYPVTHYQGYKIPQEFWGLSLVRPAKEMQDLINKVYSIVVENALKLATGKWFKDHASGVTDKELTDTTGDVVTVNQGTNVWREPGTELPSYIQNVMVDLEHHLGNVAGVHDVSSGQAPQGVSAASAMEMLKQSDQTRLSTIIRAQDRAEERSAKQKLKQIQMFSNRNDVFKYVSQNEEAGKPEFEKMHVTDSILMGSYKVKHGSKAFMPLSHRDKFKFYLSLGEAGFISGQEVLKQSGIPGADRIIQNQKEKQREKMVIQNMIQQMLEQGANPQEVYKRVKNLNVPSNQKVVQIPDESNIEMTNVMRQTLSRTGLEDSRLMEIDFRTAINLSEQQIKQLKPEEIAVIGEISNLYGLGDDI